MLKRARGLGEKGKPVPRAYRGALLCVGNRCNQSRKHTIVSSMASSCSHFNSARHTLCEIQGHLLPQHPDHRCFRENLGPCVYFLDTLWPWVQYRTYFDLAVFYQSCPTRIVQSVITKDPRSTQKYFVFLYHISHFLHCSVVQQGRPRQRRPQNVL